MIKVKRVYDKPSRQDGYRVLVDRIWPRGLRKEKAQVNHWLKEAAPSSDLRKWFGHDPDRWTDFQRRYARELDRKKEVVKFLKDRARDGNLTLVFSARDEKHNNAVALKRYLEGRVRRSRT